MGFALFFLTMRESYHHLENEEGATENVTLIPWCVHLEAFCFVCVLANRSV